MPAAGTVAGNFTAVGDLATARAEHTATLLSNGKVLIAGGFGVNSIYSLASAELYDPSTGEFTAIRNMNTPQALHTATLLANGKVLIAGGRQDTHSSTPVVSAEIYDPSTGTLTATGNMIAGGRARSTLLPDGRVFIAEDGNAAEIYDPASGTFALTSAYTSSGPIFVDTATLLPDGRALVTGVTGCAEECSAGTTEVYDPHSGMFSATGPRRAWDSISTATLLMNGTVLFVEGNDNALPDDVEIYDPTSGIFRDIGFTQVIHADSAAARLPDGTVLISGGQLPGGNGHPDCELYAPATSTFASAGNMITGRHLHTATLLPDGTILLAGGYSVWPNPTSKAEIYKPQAAH
jgi:hypothetical protein